MSTHDITDLAETIERTGPTPPAPVDAGIPARPAGIGTEGPEPERLDPSTMLGMTGSAGPSLDPQQPRRSGGSSTYVHNYAVSAAQYAVRDMPPRPAHHAVAGFDKLDAAWTAVEDANAKAHAAVDAIPAGIRKAETERARALAEATAPVVLPTSADVRSFLEREAMTACRAAVAERKRYDVVSEELADQIADALATSVPSQADAVLERVRDLEAAVRDLRRAADAVVTSAFEAAPGRERAPLPRETRLGDLADLETEVRALAEVASAPTRPRLEPSLERRAQINAEQMHTPGGFTEDFLALAKVERAEKYEHTRHTWGVPLSRLGQQA